MRDDPPPLPDWERRYNRNLVDWVRHGLGVPPDDEATDVETTDEDEETR